MGTRQHLAFLDATRATCADELRRIQAVNRELQPLAEPQPKRAKAPARPRSPTTPQGI